jgi:hypothetical protein
MPGDKLGGIRLIILKGKLCFMINDDNGAAAIRYGLGFGESD